jgi:hypothetical protein
MVLQQRKKTPTVTRDVLSHDKERLKGEITLPKVLDKPPAISCDSDAASVESVTRPTECSSLRKAPPHVSQPIVDSFSIISIGVFLFALAQIWPPLLLLAAYATSKLVCYCFRDNDDACVRRQMFAEFCQEVDDLPEQFRNINRYVELEESFWTNER